MRFARIGEPGAERPAAAVTDGPWHDISSLHSELDHVFLAADNLSADDIDGLPILEPGRFGAPIVGAGKIVCIGLNYLDHARETGAEPPAEPIVFLKTPATIVGPDDQVLIPRKSHKTDWEVELAVVIGAEARYLDGPHQARDHIAGYTISNDVSEREFQLERGGQWDKGKNCETFNPLGPFLLTADEVQDPQGLALRLWLNGELRQSGTTADMIFGVDHLIWYLSQFMVLHPGDVINTGTPAGVALGSADSRYLRAGDTVTVSIERLGTQNQTFAQA
jgi:2-keto-4-pentenoate hydratase/2-oxohepta-3-ene-1,7-dioic acid hydratase in catechol pathway